MVTMNVSIPKKLSDQVEKILDEGRYSSRSELVRDALRNYITDADVMTNIEGKVLGVLSVTYSLEGRNTTNAILRLQHTFADIIISTTHIHMSVPPGETLGLRWFWLPRLCLPDSFSVSVPDSTLPITSM